MENKSSMNSLNVVEFLNSEFEDDFPKLSKLQEVMERIENYEKELEEEVNPSSLDQAHAIHYRKTAEEALDNIKDLLDRQDSLQLLIEQELETAKPIKQHFEPKIEELKKTECLLNYLQWILRIEDENSQMEEILKGGISDQLIDIYERIKSIWEKLKNSECKNLVEYSKKTMLYWHEILLEKFGNEFKKAFGSLNWPVLASNFSTPLNQSLEGLVKFNQLFMSVHKIALPNEYIKTLDIVEGIEDSSILLPLQLMLQPLQKRFAFHFMGKKPTNRLDKPEWYLTQVLTWISDHSLFLEESVQPLLDKEGLYFNARIQIMKGLVRLAIMRFKSDLTCLFDDDRLFSHAMDEILLFSQELQNQGYPASYPNLTQILTEEHCFMRWMSLEHQGALEKMDKFLSKDSAWKSRYQDESDIDDMLVPECAELFVTLLLTMTERYSNLEDKDCQVSFLDLQLELLDDFRLRLHQLSQCPMQETIQPSYCGIINGLYYVTTILEEWNNLPFFLHLYSYKKKRNAYEELLRESEVKPAYVLRRKNTKTNLNNEELLEQSVFDEIIALFEHMQNDLLNTLCERVLLDIKAKSRPYRKEKWFCLPVQDKKLIEISPSAYPMLEIINCSLLSLQELLAKPLFTKTWQQIAEELNIYLYEEMILQNSFSEGGAAQLNFDMKRNLFPIFGSYTLKPENYFKLVRDSCALLNLSSAPAMLLKETLKCDESPEAKSSALQELGVFSLSPSQALIILSQRNFSNL